MLTDLSFLVRRFGKESPKPLESVRLELIDIESGKDDEIARVAYEAVFGVYDSGKILTAVYRRNVREPDAIENRILDLDECAEEKEQAILDVVDEFLSTAPALYPTTTCITLETVQGKLTYVLSENLGGVISYLPIPSHLLHVPTLSIAELQRISKVAIDVDCVRWKGKTFAFKKTGECLEGTIRELTILDRLRASSRIIDLEGIVVNRENCIRGFLTLYMHAGHLPNVFLEGRRHLGVGVSGGNKLVFDWSLKLSWALQVAQGVADLHAITAYNGDLKPTNVLLNFVGQAVLIDFLPMGISESFAAPELLVKFRDHSNQASFQSLLTAPADVYSLGLVLYVIAQERVDGYVKTPVWEGGAIPIWYQNIVQRCMNEDPASRPSAVEVCDLLQSGDSQGHVM